MTISRNLSILAEGVNSSGVLAATNGGTGVTANTDYQAYLAWLAEGNTPLPPDED